MRTYFDTSGLIRAWRLKKTPEGVTRAHSLAEFYCVMTGPGIAVQREGETVKLALSPKDAAAAARETFSRMNYYDLKPKAALDELEAAARKNVHGKNIHDWMHCAAADLSQSDKIVTLNFRHFQGMTKLPVVSPADHFA